jgi:hypothetical protein
MCAHGRAGARHRAGAVFGQTPRPSLLLLLLLALLLALAATSAIPGTAAPMKRAREGAELAKEPAGLAVRRVAGRPAIEAFPMPAADAPWHLGDDP